MLEAREGTSGPFCGQDAVGWVGGDTVPGEALDTFMAGISHSDLGCRLGLAGSTTGGSDWEKAVRGWAAKALLEDWLLRQETARLGVKEPGSVEEWVRCLEAAGELSRVRSSTPTDALAYYRANLHLYHLPEARHVRHLLVGDEGTAEGLMAALTDLADLEPLASEFSLDEGSRQRGGDLGWVERGQLCGPLEDVIFSAAPGQIGGPVLSQFGWHIVGVEALRPAKKQPFSGCELAIRAKLDEDRRQSAWVQWWRGRLAKMVTAAPEFEHPLRPGVPGLPHRH
ncbi:MAG TPA: peptidylprolyl isomerase [Acidimicrobiales bacterium]|nr:peptidylprolyl isomerase [Acidimicrobiales bacterium]